MATVWDDDAILRLIELVKSKQILWLTSNRYYKNKTMKIAAWDDISNSLGVPTKDVESKMHVLRSQFARERKKMAGDGAADNRKPKWKFYDSMRFLLSESTTTGGSDTVCVNQMTIETEHPPEAVTVPATTTPLSSPQSPHFIRKKTEKRNASDNFNEIYQRVEPSKRKTNDCKDEFDFYGQYVASELRAVDDQKAVLQAKSLINSILIDVRMGKYNYSCGFQTTQGCDTTSASTSFATHTPVTPDNIEQYVIQIKSESETDANGSFSIN